LPAEARQSAAGRPWVEIKHDGFRILAQRQGAAIRLMTRNGNDLADRFPLAVEALAALPVKSCVIDGEANR
jgi:ATP-dependent DNA ligase